MTFHGIDTLRDGRARADRRGPIQPDLPPGAIARHTTAMPTEVLKKLFLNTKECYPIIRTNIELPRGHNPCPCSPQFPPPSWKRSSAASLSLFGRCRRRPRYCPSRRKQMLAAYHPETPEQLHLAAEIISFSAHALEALAQAANPDLSLNQNSASAAAPSASVVSPTNPSANSISSRKPVHRLPASKQNPQRHRNPSTPSFAPKSTKPSRSLKPPGKRQRPSARTAARPGPRRINNARPPNALPTT